MHLSSQTARNIVAEVNKVIPQKINLFNDKGIVIASTDNARIGSFHGAAMRIIQNSLEEVIVRYDGEFDGAKEGTNFPILLQGRIIGVLGITGKYQEIATNALIIKRMTELLLANEYASEQRHLGENVRNRYLEQWLTGDVKSITTEFVERGRTWNIDITIPRRIIDCTVYSTINDSSLETMKAIEDAEKNISKYIATLDRNNLYFKDGSSVVCAVTLHEDAAISKLAKALIEIVGATQNLKLAVGVDAGQEGYLYARSSLSKARRANKVCMRTHNWDIRFYGDLNMEVFAEYVSESTKIEYIHRIYKKYTKTELTEAVMLLDNYFDAEGSINETANRMFLHKNTVQYKLKRIYEKTGYDPRSIRHSSLFYIANYFYRDLSADNLFTKN